MNEQTSSWRAYFWPGFIIALLSGQVIMLSGMVYIATSDLSFAVEPDYYQKGLHWDDIAAQRQQNEELGWKIAVEFGDPSGALAERELRCVLTDRDGAALDGAFVDMVAFPHSRGSERELVMLEPAGDGVYTADMRFQKKGLWEFRFVVRRDPEVFTHVERTDVYPPGESRPWRR
jgi:nitrogen fixation protein FixH